jgi:RHH-type rel operon transcriptional repressor/antitoxin RelB
MEETTIVTVQLPIQVKQRLEELARTTAQSEDRLAATAISSYLDLQGWQIGEIEKGIAEADAGEFASDEELAAFFAKWSNAR